MKETFKGMPIKEVVKRLLADTMPGDPEEIIEFFAEQINSGRTTWEELGIEKKWFISIMVQSSNHYHGKDIRGDDYTQERYERLFK